MNIKTKFNIGDIIYYFNLNKINMSKIISITVIYKQNKSDLKSTNDEENIEKHIIYEIENQDRYYENELFSSVDDLLKSLKENFEEL